MMEKSQVCITQTMHGKQKKPIMRTVDVIGPIKCRQLIQRYVQINGVVYIAPKRPRGMLGAGVGQRVQVLFASKNQDRRRSVAYVPLWGGIELWYRASSRQVKMLRAKENWRTK